MEQFHVHIVNNPANVRPPARPVQPTVLEPTSCCFVFRTERSSFVPKRKSRVSLSPKTSAIIIVTRIERSGQAIEMAAAQGLKSTTGPTAHCHAIGAKPEVGSIRKYVAHWLSSAALSVLPSVPGFTCATQPTLVRALVCVYLLAWRCTSS